MIHNNLIVCNCANCEQCDSDEFEFYCQATQMLHRRIERGCDLFKCRIESGSSMTFSGEINI